MVSIYSYAREDKKIWSLLGLVFGIVYAIMASTNYLIQFIAIQPALLSGDKEGLALWVIGNQSRSIFWALAASYGYMSISMLFTAWVFGNDPLEKRIKWAFVIVGVTAPLQFAAILLNLDIWYAIPPTLAWVVCVPFASLSLAALFKRDLTR